MPVKTLLPLVARARMDNDSLGLQVFFLMIISTHILLPVFFAERIMELLSQILVLHSSVP